jgi:serine/threonine protein phosphatase 1
VTSVKIFAACRITAVPHKIVRTAIRAKLYDGVCITGAYQLNVLASIEENINPAAVFPWAKDKIHQSERRLAWNLLTAEVRKERPRVPAGRRIYAVGDIHGRADLLAELFVRIDEDLRSRPNVNAIQVFLGDYIDRGPHSRKVIELLINRRRSHQMMFLKGNHEDCVLRVLTDPSVFSEWKMIGGLSTILSYGVVGTGHHDPQSHPRIATAVAAAIPDSHHRFLRSLRLSFSVGDYFFAHAGVRPGIPLAAQSPQDLLWIREDFLLHEEDFGKIIVHGHTPAREPEIRRNRINIDTGAYATGRLTCLVLENDQMSFL